MRWAAFTGVDCSVVAPRSGSLEIDRGAAPDADGDEDRLDTTMMADLRSMP
jgi:hypothetical protein